jgi:pyruvyltransferase
MIKKALNTAKVYLKFALPLYFCDAKDCLNNWGDMLSPYIVKKLSKKKIIHSKYLYKLPGIKVYSAIGSMLDNLSTPNVIVWGSGFKHEKGTIKRAPLKVFAVRGPLSRKRLMDLGIVCPEIYGDPAILLPMFYNPEIIKKNELGLIPHYIDKNNKNVTRLVKEIGVKFIDINSGIERVVDEIKSCKFIASSSLHGIIAANTYGIPAIWIKFSDSIIGGDFKFLDYFQSISSDINSPLIIDEKTEVRTILESYRPSPFQIDRQKLLNACPFYQR